MTLTPFFNKTPSFPLIFFRLLFTLCRNPTSHYRIFVPRKISNDIKYPSNISPSNSSSFLLLFSSLNALLLLFEGFWIAEVESENTSDLTMNKFMNVQRMQIDFNPTDRHKFTFLSFFHRHAKTFQNRSFDVHSNREIEMGS